MTLEENNRSGSILISNSGWISDHDLQLKDVVASCKLSQLDPMIHDANSDGSEACT